MLIKSADDKSSRLRFLEELKNQSLTDWQRKKLDEDLKHLRAGIAGEQEAAYTSTLAIATVISMRCCMICVLK